MSLPERIPCKCGDLKGDLVLKQAVVEFTDDGGKKRRVQPSEFENLGGKAAAKKWKTSVKVRGLAGFDGKEIGLYLREELGVDINRGVFTTSVSTKPGAPTKPVVASSKTAVAKLALAVKAGAHVSKTSRPAAVTATKRPLEDRLRAQLKNVFVCYEVPTPSKFSADAGKPSKKLQLAGTWPQLCKASTEVAGGISCQPVTIEQQSNDECGDSDLKTAGTHTIKGHSVEILNALPEISAGKVSKFPADDHNVEQAGTG